MPDRRYSRTPDTLAVLTACALAGLLLAVTRTVPGSVDDLVPRWVGLAWAVIFSASATASLVGLLHRDQITGWFLEVFGRIVLAGAAAVYCLALTAVATSWNSTVIICLTGAIAFSSAYRARQVLRRLHEVKDALRKAREA